MIGGGMELKAFVATTLTAIVEGIVEAQGRALELGAHVNPGGLMRGTTTVQENSLWDNRDNNYARSVSFDVALTVEEDRSMSARVGVVAGIFNAGADGSSGNKQLAVNRIQFSVPVLFPATSLPEEARAPRRQ
jgi:hypothetical protein